MSSLQIGEWNFEPIQYRVRRVKKYGDKYSAVCTITIVDGEPHIEGLLSIAQGTAKDKTDIHNFIKLLGFDYYISSKYIDGERVITRIDIGD